MSQRYRSVTAALYWLSSLQEATPMTRSAITALAPLGLLRIRVPISEPEG
ncbi:hypothetical protein H6G97_06710 [Nostoc flagelliforme FACHB-838]|uniref:Uncharacterized protein n=1 Tax=Nostoc flagelliforme FACHB-838 TaxID=2692904 RepID=A0ABR8DJ45_9NOSO|nr:hypothetical protein [Nostoc flagelliforme]MBD2529279.1 hypothetical protein [Nostoc flagelliforme FACHB-838]